MKSQRIKTILAFLLPIQILLLRFLKTVPEFVEYYYSFGIYPAIAKTLRFLFGWLPFSFGDLLYFFAVVALLYNLYKVIKNKRRSYKKIALNFVSVISVAFFLFHLLWAFNYYRLPLSQKLFGKTQKSVDSLVLYNFTNKIIDKVNTLQFQITNDSLKKVENNQDFTTLKQNAVQSYDLISKQYDFLKYDQPSIKKSLYSINLAYAGFSGYINPFTNEAQVSSIHPQINYPTTILHEMAHQLGFSAENEANFIACITAMNSNDKLFEYAGYLMAVRHCLYDVYRSNPTKFKELNKRLNKGVLANIQEMRDFHKAYRNPLEPYFKKTYNTFLKANNQKQGIKSYSYMVGLLIDYVNKNS